MSRKAPLCAEVLDQEARRLVPGLLEHARVPGLSAAVVQGGRALWSAAYGLKDSTTRAPVGGETVFAAGSLSKPLFAYGVLVLCAQGELDLDIPLRCYV